MSKPKYKNWGQQITDGVEYSNDHDCPECGHDFRDAKIVGFVINPPGIDSYGERPRLIEPNPEKPYAFVYECQKCFQKYWIHPNITLIETMILLGELPPEIVIQP